MKNFYILLFLLPSFCFANTDMTLDTVKVLNVKDLQISAMIEELRQTLSELFAAEKGTDPQTKLRACLKTGDLYRRERFYFRALIHYRNAEKWAEQTGDPQKVLDVQALIATTLLDNGQPQEAHDALLRLFLKIEKNGSYQFKVQTLQQLAGASMAMNNFTVAKAYYLQCKNLTEQHGDRESLPVAWNNLGFTAHQMKDFQAAIQFFTEAENAAKSLGKKAPAYVFTNLGIAWNNLGEKNRAVENLLRAEEAERSDSNNCYIRHLLSAIYLKNQDVYNALRYNESALKSAKKAGNKEVLSDALDLASEIYQHLFEYDKALDFYKKHLALKDSLLREQEVRMKVIENIHSLLEQTENEVKDELAAREVRQLTENQQKLKIQTLQLEADNLRLEDERRDKELALLRREQEVKEANLRTAQLETERNQQALVLIRQELLAERQQRELANLSQRRQLDSLEAARQQAEQQQHITQLEKQKLLDDQELKRQEEFRKNALRLVLILGAISLVIFTFWLNTRRLNKRLANQNQQIEAQKREIDSERSRAEGLLLNILPNEVAQELKTNGTATPRHYKSATVLFTDFAGFTKIAATMPPGQVVQALNECFLVFDEIIERHGLEKIKTIGDSYMCAGGLPKTNDSHPKDAVTAALEIMDFIEKRNRSLAERGKQQWPMRIGIHTGEVVAGVVGSKKFAFDIWGDTVNVASRMENNAVPGQINISEATHRLVSDRFPCTYRGEVEVKNKGKMGMYVVEASTTGFSYAENH